MGTRAISGADTAKTTQIKAIVGRAVFEHRWASLDEWVDALHSLSELTDADLDDIADRRA